MSLSAFEVTASKVICRRTIGFRVGIGSIGVLFGVMCLPLFYYFWPSPGSLADRSPADILGLPLSFLLVPLAGLCGPTAIFLYAAGPEDLIIDTVQRTYRFRRGFPLLASWQSGPLEDIAGLRVKTVQNKAGSRSLILLDWKNTRTAPWTLGDGDVSSRRPFQMLFTRDADRVRDEVQRLARRLGVPIQETEPVLEQARRRVQRRTLLVPAALFFVLLGLPPLLVGHALETEGKSVAGTVTALRTGKGRSVRYTYPVGTRVFTGRDSVPGSIYSSLEVGGPVPIHYLPSYPHTSGVIGADGGQISGPALLMAGILLAIVVLGRTSRGSE